MMEYIIIALIIGAGGALAAWWVYRMGKNAGSCGACSCGFGEGPCAGDSARQEDREKPKSEKTEPQPHV